MTKPSKSDSIWKVFPRCERENVGGSSTIKSNFSPLRDSRGKTVGAGEVAGDRERQSLAGWKIDSARVVGGACDHEHDNKGGNSDEEDSGNLVHETLAS